MNEERKTLRELSEDFQKKKDEKKSEVKFFKCTHHTDEVGAGTKVEIQNLSDDEMTTCIVALVKGFTKTREINPKKFNLKLMVELMTSDILHSEDSKLHVDKNMMEKILNSENTPQEIKDMIRKLKDL